MRSPRPGITQAGALCVEKGKTDKAGKRLLLGCCKWLTALVSQSLPIGSKWRRLSAKSPLTRPDHQIRPKGLSTNSWVLRMYFANMASDVCPVCARMLDDDTPDMAALVANPARKL